MKVNWTELLTLRMMGDNVTLYRSAWMELVDELREDSTLAKRIREMLER